MVRFPQVPLVAVLCKETQRTTTYSLGFRSPESELGRNSVDLGFGRFTRTAWMVFFNAVLSRERLDFQHPDRRTPTNGPVS